MLTLTRGEMGAAMAAILAVTVAAVSGYLIADVSHETPAAFDVVPPVESVPLARILHEDHLTSWEGMSGGSTLDAKVVKTRGVMALPPAGWGRIHPTPGVEPQEIIQPLPQTINPVFHPLPAWSWQMGHGQDITKPLGK